MGVYNFLWVNSTMSSISKCMSPLGKHKMETIERHWENKFQTNSISQQHITSIQILEAICNVAAVSVHANQIFDLNLSVMLACILCSQHVCQSCLYRSIVRQPLSICHVNLHLLQSACLSIPIRPLTVTRLSC